MFGLFGLFGGKKTYTVNLKKIYEFNEMIQTRRKNWDEQVQAARQRIDEETRRIEKELAEDARTTNAE